MQQRHPLFLTERVSLKTQHGAMPTIQTGQTWAEVPPGLLLRAASKDKTGPSTFGVIYVLGKRFKQQLSVQIP